MYSLAYKYWKALFCYLAAGEDRLERVLDDKTVRGEKPSPSIFLVFKSFKVPDFKWTRVLSGFSIIDLVVFLLIDWLGAEHFCFSGVDIKTREIWTAAH